MPIKTASIYVAMTDAAAPMVERDADPTGVFNQGMDTMPMVDGSVSNLRYRFLGAGRHQVGSEFAARLVVRRFASASAGGFARQHGRSFMFDRPQV
ncbi:hypothetical protein [Acidihalobacter ferrooxydans]|uniref:Uncharacterized protein n=1 Tax=Acidihalobacter ferrooxydans TaxID=1765967 RepID=A0A1P8UF65_9GAMM|nr:hypothetical protein [Acidihalobacter ferrooxydans]APZ42431.1 hypothetical protein BW247_04460 [Acidihalobacter ferrooxydans]